MTCQHLSFVCHDLTVDCFDWISSLVLQDKPKEQHSVVCRSPQSTLSATLPALLLLNFKLYYMFVMCLWQLPYTTQVSRLGCDVTQWRNCIVGNVGTS